MPGTLRDQQPESVQNAGRDGPVEQNGIDHVSNPIVDASQPDGAHACVRSRIHGHLSGRGWLSLTRASVSGAARGPSMPLLWKAISVATFVYFAPRFLTSNGIRTSPSPVTPILETRKPRVFARTAPGTFPPVATTQQPLHPHRPHRHFESPWGGEDLVEAVCGGAEDVC